MMGDKVAARALAQKVNVPDFARQRKNRLQTATKRMKIAKEIGFPLIIKAAFGGGGRGMRVVHKAADLADLLDEAQSEAGRAFGNPAVFLEKYIPRAKHIEVQILGDQHGNVMHLHERDCSVQRRHQKVIEIAPSRRLDRDACAQELCEAAVRMAREISYDNAGTVEFLYDLDTHEWFFIEMNPRIQVEHTVTEVITGIDLVRAQILDRAGPRSCTGRKSACRRRRKFRATATPCNAASPPKTRKTNSRRITAGFSTYRSRRRLRHPAGRRHGLRRRASSRRFTIRCW